MRLVFFGTPTHAANVLRSLVEAGHEVALVVTQPDRKRQRSGGLSPTPVKALAQELGLPVTHRVKDVLDVQADLGVLVAFGRLVKPEILRHVTILNLHPSLLPRWRGATPVEAAILAGDNQTGICIMQLAEEMDAGPVYAKVETTIGKSETSADLYDRLFAAGTLRLLTLLSSELPEPAPQVGEVTFCGKLSPEDFHADWTQEADHLVRLTRIGKVWTTFRDRRFLIVEATVSDDPVKSGDPGELEGVNVSTSSGSIQLIRVQPEGKPVQEARDWVNGARLQPGERFV